MTIVVIFICQMLFQAYYQGHPTGAVSTLRTVLPKRRKWEDLTNQACMKPCHLPLYIYRSIIRLLHGLSDPTVLHRNQICTALRTGLFMTKVCQELTRFPLQMITKPDGLNIFSKDPTNIHLDFST